MNEVQTNAPLCKTITCKKPLTYLENSKCWRCLICNPIRDVVPVVKQKKTFLDVKMTEERVVEMIKEALERGAINYVIAGKKNPEVIQVEIGEGRIRTIVREELENWHIQKPPVTRDEISTNTYPTVLSETPVIDGMQANAAPEKTWRDVAKGMGITLHQTTGGVRKKVDVLADIEKRKNDEEL